MHWIALRTTKRVSIIHKSNLTFYALHNPAALCITQYWTEPINLGVRINFQENLIGNFSKAGPQLVIYC